MFSDTGTSSRQWGLWFAVCQLQEKDKSETGKETGEHLLMFKCKW